MLTVNDIMTKDPITLQPEDSVGEAAQLLLENHINGIPVVEEGGALVGIICQSDLVVQQKKLSLPSFFSFLDGYISLSSGKQMDKEIKKMAALTVAEAMTADPTVVSPDTSLEEAATLMVDKNFHTLPVVDQGNVVGVVGQEDILRTLIPSAQK